MKISKKRANLLLELESLVGSECYNANIQNWGPNGVFEGEGRDFRYPITFIDNLGMTTKKRSKEISLPPSTAISGYYAFGANELHIMRGLNKALSFLEERYGLKL
jgi:hypothetical protein